MENERKLISMKQEDNILAMMNTCCSLMHDDVATMSVRSNDDTMFQ